jgi:hypothetical protein
MKQNAIQNESEKQKSSKYEADPVKKKTQPKAAEWDTTQQNSAEDPEIS